MLKRTRAILGMVLPLVWCALGGCQHQGQGGGATASGEPANAYSVYVGTFTGKTSKGIYLLHMDATTGQLSRPELAAIADSPSFLALHPNHKFIYSVNEIDQFNGNRTGSLSSFAVESSSGKLKLLNQQSSGGPGPTHLCIDATGRVVLVANYAGGSVASVPVRADGALDELASIDQRWGTGADKSRQEGPHAHCIYCDPNNRFALSCDLGLDKVFVYRLDPVHGTISPNNSPFATVAPGSGPRHLAFGKSGRFVYVNNEMACTVTAFAYDPDHGRLSEIQTISTLPQGFTGDKSTAEIMVHPSGKFLYVSNRGSANSIAVFRIDRQTGRLTLVDHTSTQGRTPRGFGIDPAGRWLLAANQDTDNIVVFRIDPQTGRLTPAGVDVQVPTPVCVIFVPQ
ncbi:MAG TPA: lactonase family protein [Tepidisphaeraceae bacterium]|nr:lactonase family protein [Tepidisphaeraceae bacterium]